MSERKPPVPAGMARTRGGRLWRDIVAEHDLRPDELRLLEDACRTADMVDRLEREVAKAPLTVAGSMGQPVPNPLIAEVRQQRAILAQLLRRLDLPDEPEAEQAKGMAKSTKARQAARARWGTPYGA